MARNLTPSFEADADAWNPWPPAEVAERLARLPVTWAVAGGWAIDLYLGRVTRSHADIEIVMARTDLPTLRHHLTELEWFAVGEGRAWPIEDAPQGLRQTWGRDASGHWRLDVFREEWDAGDWIFRRDPRIRRPLHEVIARTADGVPYLAPEIALLYKAKTPAEKDEADFTAALPFLTEDRATWLRQVLLTAHPDHPWISRLAAMTREARHCLPSEPEEGVLQFRRLQVDGQD